MMAFYGLGAPMVLVELKRSCSRLAGCEGVDDNDTLVTFDEGRVGKVEAPYLVDAVNNLEEPALRCKLGLAPQARVGLVGGVFLEEPVHIVIPHKMAVSIGDGIRLEGADEVL